MKNYIIADDEKKPLWCAPVHAWRALGQLKAQDAIKPLINCFESFDDSDYANEEFPKVLGKIGKSAIKDLTQYLVHEESAEEFPKVTALLSLEKIAEYNKKDEETFNKIVKILVSYLNSPNEDNLELNAFVVGSLVELNKIHNIFQNVIETIRKLYKKELAALYIMGDIEDVEIEFGVREKRDTPKPNYYSEEDKDYYNNNQISMDDISNINIPARSDKIGRNDPCYCGSGKKYKKCCLLEE